MARQRRLIGTATTDANGVATLTYNGTGAGLIQIEAEVVASNQTYTSETYEIGDWIFYDGGVTGDNNRDGWTLGSTVTFVETNENGTVLSVANATTSNSNQYTNTTFSDDFEAIICIENLNSIGVRLGVLSGNTRKYTLFTGGSSTPPTYFKIVRESGVTSIWGSTDNETWSSRNVIGTEPSGAVSIYIGMYNTTSTPMSFTYRGLKVKSI